MKMFMYKADGGLRPRDEESQELFNGLELSQVYTCEVKRPRNYEFHKKFFALVNYCWENLPEHDQKGYVTKENFRGEIVMKAGYFEVWYSPNGHQHHKPKSISFASMGEEEFQRMYDKALDYLSDMFALEKSKLDSLIEQFG